MKRLRRRGYQSLHPSGRRRLAVVIPCLNEESTIRSVLSGVPKRIGGIDDVVCVVVDDGSTDASARLALKAGAVVVSHPVPKGVGAAFHTGVEEALRLGAEYIVNMDGDGQFDPTDIPNILAPLLRNRADFVTASRFADHSVTPEMPGLKKWGNKGMAWLMTSLTGERLYDVSCGFRAYTREAALNLNLMGKFTYTQETLLNLVFKGYRIAEVPVRVRGEREFGESRVASSVIRYAVKSAKIIFRSYRDYRPFLFFGTMAAWCFAISFCLIAILFWHYWKTGGFTGHLWAGFVGGGFAMAGLLLFVVATVADMLDRIRENQERILYFLRSRHLAASSQQSETVQPPPQADQIED